MRRSRVQRLDLPHCSAAVRLSPGNNLEARLLVVTSGQRLVALKCWRSITQLAGLPRGVAVKAAQGAEPSA